jgi:hypothetical protein
VGSSVIIGGHKKKAEKVLQYLRRMYMPLQNYKDLEQDFLASYWLQGKDVLAVTHFADLVPDVVWLGPAYEERLHDLIGLRISYKLAKYRGQTASEADKRRILDERAALRALVEAEIVRRLEAIRSWLRDASHDPHLSLGEILRGIRPPGP